jgi:hypothetical protein
VNETKVGFIASQNRVRFKEVAGAEQGPGVVSAYSVEYGEVMGVALDEGD